MDCHCYPIIPTFSFSFSSAHGPEQFRYSSHLQVQIKPTWSWNFYFSWWVDISFVDSVPCSLTAQPLAWCGWSCFSRCLVGQLGILLLVFFFSVSVTCDLEVDWEWSVANSLIWSLGSCVILSQGLFFLSCSCRKQDNDASLVGLQCTAVFIKCLVQVSVHLRDATNVGDGCNNIWCSWNY